MVEPGTTQVPEQYDSLKQRIAEQFPKFSKQLKQIARYVLDFPDDLALETVATVAQRAVVQPSSVVRFAKSLGFDGFSDMQQVFRTHLVSRSQGFEERSYQDRINTIRQRRASSSNIYSQVLGDFVDQGSSDLSQLRYGTFADDIEKAVALLRGARNTYVVAQRRAFPVAFYLYYALGRLDQRVHLLDSIGGTMSQQAGMIDDNDLLIAISFPPYSPQVVEMANGCAERNIPVISITDGALSPIALESTLTFELRQPDDQAFRSLVAPMCLAQSVVVSLGHELALDRNGGAAGDDDNVD